MLRRPVEDMSWLGDAKVDSPEMEETAAGMARGEQRLASLARLAELGMELAEAAAASAKAKLDAAAAADAAPPSRRSVRRAARTSG
jgi:uncharacterized protein YfiM (DUF2279 family)